MTLNRRHVLSGAASLISLAILPGQTFCPRLGDHRSFQDGHLWMLSRLDRASEGRGLCRHCAGVGI